VFFGIFTEPRRIDRSIRVTLVKKEEKRKEREREREGRGEMIKKENRTEQQFKRVNTTRHALVLLWRQRISLKAATTVCESGTCSHS
jgi:hypothetical protein